MIRNGSTIIMKAWDMKYKPNSDWNHAWGAAPANLIVEFKDSGKLQKYSITIPGNMNCDFVIPDIHKKAIILNGKKLIPGEKTVALLPGLNKLVIRAF